MKHGVYRRVRLSGLIETTAVHDTLQEHKSGSHPLTCQPCSPRTHPIFAHRVVGTSYCCSDSNTPFSKKSNKCCLTLSLLIKNLIGYQPQQCKLNVIWLVT